MSLDLLFISYKRSKADITAFTIHLYELYRDIEGILLTLLSDQLNLQDRGQITWHRMKTCTSFKLKISLKISLYWRIPLIVSGSKIYGYRRVSWAYRKTWQHFVKKWLKTLLDWDRLGTSHFKIRTAAKPPGSKAKKRSIYRINCKHLWRAYIRSFRIHRFPRRSDNESIDKTQKYCKSSVPPLDGIFSRWNLDSFGFRFFL